ncbi:MAG: alpha/beta fold hydrolase [Solirubrobacterales bacterium]
MASLQAKIARGFAGAAVGAAAGWTAAQRSDSRRIRSDPRWESLKRDLGGRRETVRAADGTALSVGAWGPEDAPTVVLIHGWTCAKEFWTLQIQALQGQRRVVAFDLRGHGESDRSAERDYTIETFGEDLEAVLEACVPEGERVLVAGHSLGAMAIVAWAGDHPEQVDERLSAAVLINTGVGDLISESLVVEGMPDRFAQIQRFSGELFMKVSAPLPAISTALSHRIVRHVALGPDATPGEVAFCERLVLSCPDDVRGAVGGTLTRIDLRESLDSLKVPTLVVSGECDRFTPPVHAREMAEELPDLIELVEIPRSGHMSPVEASGRVSELLEELAGVPARA